MLKNIKYQKNIFMFTCTKQIFFSFILYFCLALLFYAIFLLRTVFEADKPNVTK